jgi:hypothetical protein
VPFKGAIYAGEHEGIVERALFDKAQAILDENQRLHVDRPKTRLVFPSSVSSSTTRAIR